MWSVFFIAAVAVFLMYRKKICYPPQEFPFHRGSMIREPAFDSFNVNVPTAPGLSGNNSHELNDSPIYKQTQLDTTANVNSSSLQSSLDATENSKVNVATEKVK